MESEKPARINGRFRGYAQLDDVAEALGIELPTDVYDTFNGFLCDIIGKVRETARALHANTKI